MSLLPVLEGPRILPLLTLTRESQAVPAAEALVAAGALALAVVLRGTAATKAVQAIAKALPQAVVGVAGVTRVRDVAMARDCGAGFLLSPGCSAELAEATQQAGLALMPGVSTVSEMMGAREEGFLAQVLYPAAYVGGPGFLRMVRPMMPDLMFCIAGGINETNYADWLGQPNVACVAGGWMAPRPVVDAEDWGTIKELTRRAIAGAAAVGRGQAWRAG